MKSTENSVNFLIYFLLYTHICYLSSSFIRLQWYIDLRYVQHILSERSMFQNLLQLCARKDMLSFSSQCENNTHENNNNLKCVHMLTAFFCTQTRIYTLLLCLPSQTIGEKVTALTFRVLSNLPPLISISLYITSLILLFSMYPVKYLH